jgi:hypothetical protein
MSKTVIFVLVVGSLIGAGTPALAQDGSAPSEGRGDQEFIGVDLDNGGVYYNGRNSGRSCVPESRSPPARARFARAPTSSIVPDDDVSSGADSGPVCGGRDGGCPSRRGRAGRPDARL